MNRFAALDHSTSKKSNNSETQELKTSDTQIPKSKADSDVVFFGAHKSRMFRDTFKRIALDEGTTLSALIGEMGDMLLRSRGKHPLGER